VAEVAAPAPAPAQAAAVAVAEVAAPAPAPAQAATVAVAEVAAPARAPAQAAAAAVAEVAALALAPAQAAAAAVAEVAALAPAPAQAAAVAVVRHMRRRHADNSQLVDMLFLCPPAVQFGSKPVHLHFRKQWCTHSKCLRSPRMPHNHHHHADSLSLVDMPLQYQLGLQSLSKLVKLHPRTQRCKHSSCLHN
jgi:hypothetical protein